MDIPKPCPFCGSDFIEENESRVRCVCGARIDSSMFFKPDALEKWNTRPPYDSLLASVAKREREAFVEGARWAWGGPEDEASAEAEAARRYKEE